MSNILVFLQHAEGKLLKSTLIALGVAADLKSKWGKSEIHGIALGKGAGTAASEAKEYGLAKIFVSELGAFDRYIAQAYAPAVVAAFKESGADTLVGASTSTGKDLLPRVSGLLDAGQASDIVAVNSDGSLKRPMFAGNVFADVEITSPLKVVTLRATAFSVPPKSPGAGAVVQLSVTLDDTKIGEVVSYDIAKGGRPELTDAAIVVSGGRAMQSAENFEKVIFPLADVLGAAVGASRAAVDSGYAPNDWQVGQTGKVVAPNLYIGVGISGAIQHLAGMKDSKVIVAINKDPDAPIFEVADYGLVADLYEVVPKFTEAIKAAKS